MGTNAEVFKSLNHVSLPKDLMERVELVDEATGRLDFQEGYENPLYKNLLAASEYIGNMSSVGYLRQVVQERCGSKVPLVLTIVLAGIPAGERHVPRESLPKLDEELSVLRSTQEKTPDESVGDLLTKLERLSTAAREQNNAIIIG